MTSFVFSACMTSDGWVKYSKTVFLNDFFLCDLRGIFSSLWQKNFKEVLLWRSRHPWLLPGHPIPQLPGIPWSSPGPSSSSLLLQLWCQLLNNYLIGLSFKSVCKNFFLFKIGLRCLTLVTRGMQLVHFKAVMMIYALLRKKASKSFSITLPLTFLESS